MSRPDVRIEKDTFGPVEVPADRLWGAQTQRSLTNFKISSERMPRALIHALAIVKKAAALVNLDLGTLDPKRVRRSSLRPTRCWPASTMTSSARGLADGSGTQTNMNMNEVLANRASELLGGARGEGRLVHPNDHVNCGQSSNDVFPTAMHVAAVSALKDHLCPHRAAQGRSRRQGRRVRSVVKIGRTHLQDAVPLTLGQEFSGYVAQLEHGITHCEAALPHLCELALGDCGGNRSQCPPEYAVRVARSWSSSPAIHS